MPGGIGGVGPRGVPFPEEGPEIEKKRGAKDAPKGEPAAAGAGAGAAEKGAAKPTRGGPKPIFPRDAWSAGLGALEKVARRTKDKLDRVQRPGNYRTNPLGRGSGARPFEQVGQRPGGRPTSPPVALYGVIMPRPGGTGGTGGGGTTPPPVSPGPISPPVALYGVIVPPGGWGGGGGTTPPEPPGPISPPVALYGVIMPPGPSGAGGIA